MEALISIVDDDEAVRSALQRMFRAYGLDAHVFSSAEQFLSSDQSRQAACLILDVRMPGMSGLALHDHLRSQGCRIPTILITGCPTSDGREHALASGAVSYLAKPFAEQALLAAVQGVLRRDRQTGQGTSRGGAGASGTE